MINLTIDYRIIFTFAIILSWENLLNKKTIRAWALGLGSAAGFFALTKFTVGICTFGALFLLLLCNVYKSIYSKSNLRTSILALTDSILAAASISFVFIDPNPQTSFHKLLICGALAGAFGGGCWLLQKIFQNGKEVNFFANQISQLLRGFLKNITGWGGAYFAYSISLLVTILYIDPTLSKFIGGSLEVSSGYSSAMSAVGSPWEVGFAVFELVLACVLFFSLARENSLGFSLSLAFLAWMTFKHGFVRQDGHVLIFIFSVPFLVALGITKAKSLRTKKLGFSVYMYTLGMLLVYIFTHNPFGQQIQLRNIFQVLKPDNAINRFSHLTNLNALKKSTQEASANNLSAIKLPEKIVSKLEGKQVDIIPFEISLVAANDLDWKPKPAFQSYVAFTSLLDNANLKSFSSHPRDYILYQFASIDGRHPFFDEPATFFYLLCNYSLTSENPGFIKNAPPLMENLMLLKRRQSDICSSISASETESIRWEQRHFIKDEDKENVLVRVRIKIEYSFLGKLYKTLFRAPPVIMKVTYEGDREVSYRIVPEVANNGVLISHLPADTAEALSFFQALSFAKDRLPSTVETFQFSNQNSLLYTSDIDLKFSSYRISP